MHPILLLALVIAALLTVSWVKRLPPAARRQAGFKAALVAAAVLLVIALLTGRLNPLFVAIAAAIPVLQRLAYAKSLFDRVKSSSGSSAGRQSAVSTHFLDMSLDHDSGEMRGVVRTGSFAGRALGDMSLAELLALLDECRSVDPQSVSVLETYLDRQHGSTWRTQRSAGRATSEDMSEQEARDILGVGADACAEDIVNAHRKLMQKLHPDRGGNDYLASKINRAKDRLLRKS